MSFICPWFLFWRNVSTKNDIFILYGIVCHFYTVCIVVVCCHYSLLIYAYLSPPPPPLFPPLPLPSTLQLHAKIRWSLIDEPTDENSDDDDKTIWCIRLPVFVEPKETELLKYEEPSFRVVP